jgi:hypothetical protein
MGCYGGNFSTAGNLAFFTSWGDSSRGSTTNFTAADRPFGGTVAAYNATTGEGPLWTWQAPGLINDSAMTYQVNGKQFVAVYHRLPPTGSALYNGHGEQLTALALGNKKQSARCAGAGKAPGRRYSRRSTRCQPWDPCPRGDRMITAC